MANVFSVSLITGDNLLYWRAGMVLALAHHVPWRPVVAAFYRDTEQLVVERGWSPKEAYDYKRREALTILRRYPTETTVMTLIGLIRLYAEPGGSGIWHLAFLPALYVATILGCVRLGRRRAWPPLLLSLVVLMFFTLLSLGPEA